MQAQFNNRTPRSALTVVYVGLGQQPKVRTAKDTRLYMTNGKYVRSATTINLLERARIEPSISTVHAFSHDGNNANTGNTHVDAINLRP